MVTVELFSVERHLRPQLPVRLELKFLLDVFVGPVVEGVLELRGEEGRKVGREIEGEMERIGRMYERENREKG